MTTRRMPPAPTPITSGAGPGIARLLALAAGTAVMAVALSVAGAVVPVPGPAGSGIGAAVALAQTTGTTDTTTAEAPGVPAAGQAPANTPQPTGQPLPSKRQRVADSLVAAFILLVLVGGVAAGWYLHRRAERPRASGTAES